MGKDRQIYSNNHSDAEQYKLFEANGVAKYGICENDCPIDPVKLKILLYLLWKCNIETPGIFKRVFVSSDELTKMLGYEKDEHRHFARTSKRILYKLFINTVYGKISEVRQSQCLCGFARCRADAIGDMNGA